MKTMIQLTCLFSLLAFQPIHAEEYFKDGAVWTEYRRDIFSGDIYLSHYDYIEGDTVLNGIVYKKINSSWKYPNSFVGGLREENGKIFCIKESCYVDLEFGGELKEFLLCDFSVKVGDAIKSGACEGTLAYREPIVAKIDTIELLNGEKRKRCQLDNMCEWIEGIGSTGGLFSEVESQPTNGRVPFLSCFQQDGITLYKDERWCRSYDNCCGYPGFIEQLVNKKNFLSMVLPNPVRDKLQVSFINKEERLASISIINGSGAVIYSQLVLASSETEIDLSAYSPGVYYLIVVFDSISETHKIMRL